MRMEILVDADNDVDVNSRPEPAGESMASIFRSLSEIVPAQVPVFGCRETAAALLPGLPLIRGLTATQYTLSLDNPLNV